MSASLRVGFYVVFFMVGNMIYEDLIIIGETGASIKILEPGV
jgi:hypothetical protein